MHTFPFRGPTCNEKGKSKKTKEIHYTHHIVPYFLSVNSTPISRALRGYETIDLKTVV